MSLHNSPNEVTLFLCLNPHGKKVGFASWFCIHCVGLPSRFLFLGVAIGATVAFLCRCGQYFHVRGNFTIDAILGRVFRLFWANFGHLDNFRSALARVFFEFLGQGSDLTKGPLSNQLFFEQLKDHFLACMGLFGAVLFVFPHLGYVAFRHSFKFKGFHEHSSPRFKLVLWNGLACVPPP